MSTAGKRSGLARPRLAFSLTTELKSFHQQIKSDMDRCHQDKSVVNDVQWDHHVSALQ